MDVINVNKRNAARLRFGVVFGLVLVSFVLILLSLDMSASRGGGAADCQEELDQLRGEKLEADNKRTSLEAEVQKLSSENAKLAEDLEEAKAGGGGGGAGGGGNPCLECESKLEFAKANAEGYQADVRELEAKLREVRGRLKDCEGG